MEISNNNQVSIEKYIMEEQYPNKNLVIKLKEFINKNHLSQAIIANNLGVSTSTISLYLTSKPHKFGWKILEKKMSFH